MPEASEATRSDDERAEERIRRVIGGLLAVVLGLGAKGAADVWFERELFPRWFPPAFALGVLAFVGLTLAGAAWSRATPARRSGNLSAAAWVLLALSFPCTTILHSGYPFRLDVAEFWRDLPGLRFNLVLAGLGFVATITGGVLAARGDRVRAAVIVLALAPLLLLPNDDCANPFNGWWIAHIGASPLMYVPNVLAIVCTVAVDRGVRPRYHVALLTLVCLGTAALGIGHRTGLIW